MKEAHGPPGSQDAAEQRETPRAGWGKQEGTGSQHLPASGAGKVFQKLTLPRTTASEAPSGGQPGTMGHSCFWSRSRVSSKKR